MTQARVDLRVFASYERDFVERADVAVVGSGPGGAVVAKQLTDAGLHVVLIEEGPPFTPADYALEAGRSIARTMREGGLRYTAGTAIPRTSSKKGLSRTRCINGMSSGAGASSDAGASMLLFSFIVCPHLDIRITAD